MTMQAFNKLNTNVKGAPRSIQLAPLTFIVGGNRVGKSSLLDTIRLAVTGKHPVGPHPSDLQDLIPPDHDVLYAELVGPDGNLKWEMGLDEERRPRRSKGVRASGACASWSADQRKSILVLDHASFRSFGAERMRRVVMERFGDLDQVIAPHGLNDAQQRLWRAAHASATGDPSQQLSAMQKWFKAHAKKAGDAAKSKQSAIEVMESHTAEMGGADVLTQTEARLVEARAYEAALQRREEFASTLSLRERVIQRIAELEDVDTDSVREELKQVQASVTEAKAALTRAEAVAMLVNRAEGHCPLCGHTEFDVETAQQLLREGVARRQEELRTLGQAESSLRAQLPDAELAQLRGQLDSCDRTLRDNEAEVPEYTGPSAAELRRQCDMMREVLANKARITAEKSEVQRLLGEQATAKLLERQVTNMLNAYVQSVQLRASEAVNKFMPANFRAELHVTNTECEWRMIGMDGRAHRNGAYSGSEGGSLLISLAQAWADGSDTPYRFAMLDDVDLGVYSPEQLQALCQKFEQLVAQGDIDQVVMVWNRPSEAPSNWHTIHLHSGE